MSDKLSEDDLKAVRAWNGHYVCAYRSVQRALLLVYVLGLAMGIGLGVLFCFVDGFR